MTESHDKHFPNALVLLRLKKPPVGFQLAGVISQPQANTGSGDKKRDNVAQL